MGIVFFAIQLVNGNISIQDLALVEKLFFENPTQIRFELEGSLYISFSNLPFLTLQFPIGYTKLQTLHE